MVNPVTMTFGTDGRLFVVEWRPGGGPNDHIKVLTDTDGDGTFDQADMYMDRLELPAGVSSGTAGPTSRSIMTSSASRTGTATASSRPAR